MTNKRTGNDNGDGKSKNNSKNGGSAGLFFSAV
jgi:hypothetical protein